ncbi:hypothetical protein PSI19_11630 [Xenorhabdus khoisanae]|uniref:hypothetical protein n=1 Tax=Xenorhabdus khoisanae TaxID=880157 RepID=UPI002359F874|nr:hypothetical protein [Xenorhabdus khoisanae]MDC9614508.1 hypothetical protein [Xenorhabdus khoisanae]
MLNEAEIMMMIIIKEDGSTSITAEGYSAWYDKDGRLDMSIGRKAPQKICIHNELNQKAEKEQASKTYSAGMTLAVDEGIKAGITADGFKVCDSERKVKATVAPLELAVDINANAIINEVEQAYHAQGVFSGKLRSLVSKVGINLSDDHLRQIVREEILLFVARESERGGLFSTW